MLCRSYACSEVRRTLALPSAWIGDLAASQLVPTLMFPTCHTAACTTCWVALQLLAQTCSSRPSCAQMFCCCCQATLGVSNFACCLSSYPRSPQCSVTQWHTYMITKYLHMCSKHMQAFKLPLCNCIPCCEHECRQSGFGVSKCMTV